LDNLGGGGRGNEESSREKIYELITRLDVSTILQKYRNTLNNRNDGNMYKINKKLV
jgi:hypothetical protein